MSSQPSGEPRPPANADLERTSLSLLGLARSRDDEAWRRLMALYAPLVASWVRSSGVVSADVGDLVQEVFSSVASKLNDFRRDASGGTFRGWLRVITRNKVADYFRRGGEPLAEGGSTARLRIEQLADPGARSEEAFPEGSNDAKELTPLLSQALERVRGEFETKTWKAFWMSAVEQQPTAAIAAELEISAGAVRQSKYKVLRRLRQEMGDVIDAANDAGPSTTKMG